MKIESNLFKLFKVFFIKLEKISTDSYKISLPNKLDFN